MPILCMQEFLAQTIEVWGSRKSDRVDLTIEAVFTKADDN